MGRKCLAWICLLLVHHQLSSTQHCGKRKVVNYLIVNGTEAKDGYWPWHAAILHNNARSSVFACGGTILDQNTILTAAHCLMTSNGIIAQERLVVQVGRTRLRVVSDRTQERQAYQLIVHPEYHINSIRHDLALIKLATDITYTDYIQPICLWNRGEGQNAIVGSWGTVVGFGVDETDNPSDTLREARLPVVSAITCIESNREVFGSQLTSDMFCAGNRDGISACNGDSGGGLFFNYNDVWFIRGVVSFTRPRQGGLLCDTNEYTVFTDVAKYLQWIEQHMRGAGGQHAGNYNERKIGLLPMSTCGANPYASREESSKPVLLGYPWVGLLEYYNAELDKLVTDCHAVLISDRYLISTAYCAKRVTFQTTVIMGEYDKNTTTDCAQVDGQMVCSPPVQKLAIDTVITHTGNIKRHVNDIALIRLRDRADVSRSNVKPICLPVTNELRSKMSTYYTLTAFNYFNDYGQELKRSLREYMNSSECQQLYTDYSLSVNITTDHICVKQPYYTEVLTPVEGAPLQLVQKVQGKSRYVLYGVFSFGSFSYEIPDVYTNVASYIDWILENIQ